jgi:hypothetical protein
MTTKPESEREPAQVVDRAALAVRRAIGRLVQLLGDDDLAVVYGAALALDELGARAVVGPLAAALPRARAPRHRAAIIGALFTYRKAERAAVLRALTGAMKRERVPELAMSIRAALTATIRPDLTPARPTSGAIPTPGSADQGTPPRTSERR